MDKITVAALGCSFRIHFGCFVSDCECVRHIAADYNYFYSGFVHRDGKISKKEIEQKKSRKVMKLLYVIILD